jgi:chromosome segregation ATPase
MLSQDSIGTVVDTGSSRGHEGNRAESLAHETARRLLLASVAPTLASAAHPWYGGSSLVMPKRTASSIARESPFAEAIRANTVVLEDIRSQMAMVIEATVTTRRELWSALQGVEERLSGRIAALEAAVTQNSADIRKNSEDIRKNSEDIRKNSEDIRKNSKDIRKNSKDIQELREEVARLRHDFDHREEGARLSSLEVRVTALEGRLGTAAR